MHETDGENALTELTTVLDGGKGDDRLNAESKAWGEERETLHELSGGGGGRRAERSNSTSAIFDGNAGNDSQNVLDGGRRGSPRGDRHEGPCEGIGRAWPATSSRARRTTSPAAAQRRARRLGGRGCDRCERLSGGKGNDELAVSGGSGNELDGGTGKRRALPGRWRRADHGRREGRDTIYSRSLARIRDPTRSSTSRAGATS